MAAPDADSPAWTRPAVLAALVLIFAAARFWVAAGTGLVLDEGYYTLWSEYLSASYLDHPPAIAWQIAIGRLIAGDTELGVRLLAVFNGVVVALAIHRIGVLLFDRRTAALAVIWYTATSAAGLLFLATPDSPLVLFWTLTLWAIAEFIARRNANWLLAAGLFLGLAATAKLTAGFLAIGIALFVLSSRERRIWLGLWHTWGAALVTAAVFSPVLIWNLQHDWATVLFQGQRIAGGVYLEFGLLGNLGDLAAGQILGAGPILLVCAFIAIGVALWRRLRVHGLALAVLTSLPLILFMAQQVLRWKVEANWFVALWPGLTLAGASLIANRRHWAAAAVRWVQVATGTVLIALIYVQALFQPFDVGALDRTREQRGWAGLQRELVALAKDNGAAWIATTDAYGLTGELWTYGRFSGNAFPVAQVDQRQRYDFLPPLDPVAMGRPMYVQEIWSPSALAQLPGPVGGVFLRIVERRNGDEVLGYYATWLVP